jgi:hypothetical protein
MNNDGPKLLVENVKSKQKSGDNFITGLGFKLCGPIRGSAHFDLRVPNHFRGVLARDLRVTNESGDVIERMEGSLLSLECIESEFSGIYKSARFSFNGVLNQPIQFDVFFVFLSVLTEWPIAPSNQNIQYISELNHLISETPMEDVEEDISSDIAPVIQKQFQSNQVNRLPQSGGDAETARYLLEQDIENNPQNYINLKIIRGENVFIQVTLLKEATVLQLKRKIHEKAAETEGWPDCPVAQQRLVFGGLLLQDPVTLSSIQNLVNDSTILLTERPAGQPENEGGNDPLIEQAQLNAVAHQLKHVKILQRNFDECVRAAQRNSEPSQRQRWDDAESPTPREPTVTDLGEFTQQLSQTMLLWSHQLEELGEQLKEDKPLPADRGEPEYQLARRRIQNNMDACRYVAHEMTTFSRFVIPLARAPPRKLSIVNRR